MRRWILPLALACASLPMVACEDGPHQVFNPAPPGAGQMWNDANTPGTVNGASAPFAGAGSAGGGGTNKSEICNAPTKATIWLNMIKQPIKPSRFLGLMDLAGGDGWPGLTIEQAEGTPQMPVQCQADSQGDVFGDGQLDSTWGDAGQVFVEYLLSTHKIVLGRVFAGYEGTLTATSRDGQNKYVVGVNGIQITKNGQPWNFHFADDQPCVGSDSQSCFRFQADELYRAVVSTFQPQLPADPTGENCFDNGHCITGNFGDVAYLFLPSTGWGMWTFNRHAGIQKISKPDMFDIYPTKILGYSVESPYLKLDAVGPIGVVGTPACASPSPPASCNLGTASSPCVLQMGLGYTDFLSKCVQVTGNAGSDATELSKLLGGIQHSTERFFFNVSGIDLNFTATNLGPTTIISDTDKPQAGDLASEFVVDQSTLGKFINDRDPTNSFYDNHGYGAVYREYARLVRTNLLQLAGITDGGAGNCYSASGLASHPWCTGMEGLILAVPVSANDPAAVAFGATVAQGSSQVSTIDLFYKYVSKQGGKSVASGLKLGHQGVVFCDDPTGNYTIATDSNDPNKKVFQPAVGYQKCTTFAGDTFSTSFQRVTQVFGNGQITNLPKEAQDNRFFWKMWAQAMFKYQLAEGSGGNIYDLSTVKLDPYSLFFDSQGAGQFETAEYVERTFASPTQRPMDLNMTADVKNGIFNDYSYSNFLYRGEQALYNGILEDRSHGLGQEEALLTNIFGSPVLAAGWTPVKNNGAVVHAASECATAASTSAAQLLGCQYGPPADSNGNALLDSLGNPILKPYVHIIDHGATPFALNNTASPPAWIPTGTTDKGSPVKILQTNDFEQMAQIQVPILGNCTGSLPCSYDPFGSAPVAVAKYFVPWAPQQPGIGFAIPVNVASGGQVDKFISTSQLDLSGTTISANIDYTLTADATGKGMNVNFLAVETTDFLGDVFLCMDPDTRDVLTARMYSSVQTILDWIQNHPKSKDACQIVVRPSPFNNFPDYITSLTNGVKVNVTQGSGFGRIVDATLFVPGQ